MTIYPWGSDGHFVATVNVSCEASRKWHQPRGAKRRKFWVGRFVKVEYMDNVKDNPEATSVYVPRYEWHSLLVPRSRTYRNPNIVSELAKQKIAELEGEKWYLRYRIYEGGGLSDVEWDTLQWLEHNLPLDAVRPDQTRWYFADDQYTPEHGYLGAKYIRERNTYRLECPCDYRIKELPAPLVHTVLDKLEDAGVESISVQRLLPIVDAVEKGMPRHCSRTKNSRPSMLI